MTGREEFIRAHTKLTTPPACPELPLYLASEVTPLWQATEAFLEGHNLAPPFWAFPWVGGQALARYLLDNPALVKGKNVLDFASGCGIVAIAAAKAGAAFVTAAEIDEMALVAIAMNARENSVNVAAYNGNALDEVQCPWDVVLAGDVCYERPMAEAVFAWLRRCARYRATVLLADPGRAYLPKTGLMRLTAMTIACSLELEDRESRSVGIYRIVG
jgi:predicted nicotinamide N-methyase